MNISSTSESNRINYMLCEGKATSVVVKHILNLFALYETLILQCKETNDLIVSISDYIFRTFDALCDVPK